MTGFSRRVVGLQEVFPSSGISVAQPSEVSESVSLVHRWPSAKASLDRLERSVVSSAPDVTPLLNIIVVPQGRWVEVLFGDVSHNSATARIIQMSLLLANQVFFLGRWANMASVLGAGLVSGFEPLFSGAVAYAGVGGIPSDRIYPRWPLIVPPGATLQFRGDTAAAPWTIDVGIGFISHPLAEDGAAEIS